MTDRFSAFGRILGENQDELWRGRGRAWSGFIKSVWVFLRLFLARQLWGTAIRLAHFPPPTKTLGVGLALVSIVLIAWAFLGLWQALLVLGIKRLAIGVILVCLLVVVVNTLTIPDDRPFAARLLICFLDTGRSTGDTLVRAMRSAVQAPDEFLFAYTGQRRPPSLPSGFPTPDPGARHLQ